MAGLSLQALTKRFAGRCVVDALDLDIDDGAFVALLGPSGCGKTTTLRVLAGFEAPDEGRLLLGERLLAAAENGRTSVLVPPERRSVGMVFQSYALWPHLDVADNVGYALKLRGVRGLELRRRVEQALGTVRLAEYGRARVQSLSGGQRQRVALARCLAAEPQVVLLDEPLANLDRSLRAEMETHFRDFHRRTGATFVYVTHDQSEAMALADRIAVLEGGRLVQWASPETLYREPRTDWLAGFIGQGEVLSLALDAGGRKVEGSRLMRALGRRGDHPVLVRPEHVRPSEAGVEVEVRECVFKGERYALSLALPDGQALKGYHATALRPGERITVTLEQGWRLERQR
ncbi:ABC transporter ATP-binding protein [Halotalea alkalilenta]|uniref:ABC transporter ATP-binding protein n=1 Tax=Halotalea alkalilenta TaxID=376489 RepID=UPI000485D99D|nr:ABC transporter ATP-binding protein [Halotalea alkalilenta]